MTNDPSLQCPVCGGSQPVAPRERRYQTTHPLFAQCTIVSCANCQSGWVPHPPPPHALKAYYDEGAYGGRRWSHNGHPAMALERCQALARWRFVEAAFRGVGIDPQRDTVSVCDIGAGAGCTYEVGRYHGLPLRYFAFESSPAMQEHIRAMGGKVLDDVFQHEAAQQFDVVWASHILEHYPQPDDLLHKMRQLMKPTSIGFIEVPCLDYEFKSDVAPHLLFFSLEGLTKTLERNGFRIVRADAVGPLRTEASTGFAQRAQRSSAMRRLLKRMVPSAMVMLVRDAVAGARTLVGRARETTVATDLHNEAVFAQWALDTYGGNRSWIRAVFVCHH